MHCPELPHRFFVEKERVARIFSTCFIEWYVLCTHQEKNDTAGKEIGLEGLILILVPKLRSHILRSSKTCCRVALLCCASKWAGETEVRDFYVVILIEEAVLRFEISVCHVILMHEEYRIDDLVEEELAHAFTHVVVRHDEIEEISFLDKFHAEQGTSSS